MNKEQFIELIKQHQEQSECLDKIEQYGFYLWENPIIEFGFIMFDKVLKSNFNDKGIDWINWWLYERDNEWCSEIGKAWDENNKEIPTETIEDLWNIVEKYRI